MSTQVNDASCLLLLVEDSAADIMLVHEALGDVLLTHRCVAFSDGIEANEYLADPANELPHLILLDLNLPRMDGRELLAEIKGSLRLRHIPVVILTTSSAPQDKIDAYAGHANSYITKPVDLDTYAQTLQEAVHYWFDIVSLLPSNALSRSQ